MFKKILSILISVLILSSLTAMVFAADDMYNELAALDIVPQSFNDSNRAELVTRAELAYIAANLMQSGKLEAKNTKFVDVDANNVYSGYVDFLTEFGILSGVDATHYNPEGNVTAEMIYKVMSSVLGYNNIAVQLGGYPEGYAKIADRLGFTTKLAFSGQYITKEGALKIAHYVLTNCFDELIYFASNGDLVVATDSKSEFAVLGDRHQISVYTGSVESVKGNDFINVRIQGNKYQTNPEILATGTLATFEANGKNVREYEGANVTVWVNADNQIVYIALKRNADIKYGYVYSVNGVTNASGIPTVASLNELTLVNDEEDYEISSDVTVRYNGNIVTSNVKLEGNFVRLVFQNGEITFIETWDMAEAGIISAVTNEYIEYTKGAVSGLRLKEFDKFKNKRFYIDNQIAGEGHLKADVVFDYYASGDELVIVASEKKIIDKFYSYGVNTLEIGDSIYKFKKLYYSDGKAYKEDNEFKILLNAEISAYAAPDGYIRYIKASDGASLTNKKFYGVVYGIKNADVFAEEAEIGMWVYGDEVTKQILKVETKNNSYKNFKSDLKAVSDNYKKNDILDENSLFIFTLNSKGYIDKIERPVDFYGYDKDAESGRVKYVMNDYSISGSGSTSVSIGGKTLYFEGAPMLAIYKKDGIYCVDKFSTSNIKGKDNLTMNLYFFGDEQNSPSPSLVLVTGELKSLGDYGKKYGIITEKSLSISENGEEMVDIYVTNGDSQPLIYSLSKTDADKLPDYAIIVYKDNTKYSENGIYIFPDKTFSLSGNPDKWTLSETANNGLFEGKFEKIEGGRLYLSNDAFYMPQGAASYLIVKYDYTNKNRAMKVIDASEINKGDYIYYYLISGVVRAIIVTD